MAPYSLQPEVRSDADWDSLVSPYNTATVFHSSGWLNYLKAITGGSALRLRIAAADGQATVGYFCGMVVKKGPFKILGSPMRGWHTPNMGPVANRETFDTAAFIAALDLYCRTNGIDFFETCCDWLDPSQLEKSGFRPSADITHQIQLSTADEAWSNLYKTTRNYVRRAEKNGLIVVRADEPDVIGEHFDQLKAVFAKQGIAPPYGSERPMAMWNNLSEKQIMVLKATLGERCLASYLLVWDKQTMWGLATASWPDALDLRPNELIHWRAIETACKMGLQRYDLCGGGDYKKKYGALEVPRVRWMRAYSSLAGFGYKAAERGWELKRKLTKALHRAKPDK